MRRALLTIVLLLMASAAFAGDARVRVTLKPEAVDVEAAARELAETYAAKVVAIEGNNVVVELSIARAGLVARDPHVAAVTVLGSAAAPPPVQHSSAAPAPQRSFVPRTNNSCTPPGLPCSTGTYMYDGSGNIKQIGNDTFVYDEVSRLTSATLPSAGGVGETYTYDAFGNMQSVTSASGEGRPVITTEKSINHLDPSTLAAYDEAGNLKSWPGHTYTYDAANMLIDMVATTGGEHAAYVYTADDERIAVLNVVSSTAYEGTWRLRGLDNKVVREYYESNGSGQAQPWSWSRDYVYRGGLLLSSYLSAPGGGEKRYDYHLDHLGTPRLITDAAGRKISAHNYYPFGAEITWTDAVAETMTFTGHERDSSTTAVGPNRDYWYYMHARYDSPNLGRFLSVDSHRGKPDVPQSWNRYAYARSNPILYTDPDGNDIRLAGDYSNEVFAMLALAAQHSQSRADLTALATNHAFTVTYQDERINSVSDVFRMRQAGSYNVIDAHTVPDHASNATEAVVNIDTLAVAMLNRRDPTGKQTVIHENVHAIDTMHGLPWAQVAAKDTTGAAAAYAAAVAATPTDMTLQQATEYVMRLLLPPESPTRLTDQPIPAGPCAPTEPECR